MGFLGHHLPWYQFWAPSFYGDLQLRHVLSLGWSQPPLNFSWWCPNVILIWTNSAWSPKLDGSDGSIINRLEESSLENEILLDARGPVLERLTRSSSGERLMGENLPSRIQAFLHELGNSKNLKANKDDTEWHTCYEAPSCCKCLMCLRSLGISYNSMKKSI